MCCFCSVTPLLLATTGCTHPSHATASLHSKTENHRSFQRHHHRYHLSRSSTTIFIFITDTTYMYDNLLFPKSQTCHWVQRELTIRVKAKTCVRRDKTFLRAPVGACKTMGNGLAPSWPNKWRWRWVARRGVEGGGPAKKGSERLLCMQPLHILCNNTQNSGPLFGCSAPEKVE